MPAGDGERGDRGVHKAGGNLWQRVRTTGADAEAGGERAGAAGKVPKGEDRSGDSRGERGVVGGGVRLAHPLMHSENQTKYGIIILSGFKTPYTRCRELTQTRFRSAGRWPF